MIEPKDYTQPCIAISLYDEEQNMNEGGQPIWREVVPLSIEKAQEALGRLERWVEKKKEEKARVLPEDDNIF